MSSRDLEGGGTTLSNAPTQLRSLARTLARTNETNPISRLRGLRHFPLPPIYIYIYIRRPLLARGHQAAKRLEQVDSLIAVIVDSRYVIMVMIVAKLIA